MSIHRYERRHKKGYRVFVSRVIDGKRIRKSRVVFGPRSLAIATERRLEEKLAYAQIGERKPKTVRLGALVESYLEHAQLAKRSWKDDRTRLGRAVDHFGANTPVRSISQTAVLQWFADLRKSDLSPQTCDKHLVIFKRLFTWACEAGELDPPYNPAQYVKTANLPSPVDPRSEISDDDFLLVLQILPVEYRRLFLAARFTGLRRKHLLCLRWEQIRGGLIHPPDADTGALYRSHKRHGLVPVPDGLFGKVKSGLIWPTPKDKARPMYDIKRQVRIARKLSGVDFLFRGLRRSYATHLRRLGVPLEVRLICLGHAPPSELRVHSLYQIVKEQDLLEVGQAISADFFYQRCKSLIL